MNGKSIAVSLGVVVGVGLVAYLTYQPEKRPVGDNAASDKSAAPEKVAVDKVAEAVSGVVSVVGGMSAQIPKSTITAYRPVTDELLKSGAMPKAFQTGGVAKNGWGGNVIVQIFPANAWKAGVQETVNVVIEAVPEGDCSALVRRLSQLPSAEIFQINVEPSKKFHTVFPVAGDTGCLAGVNNIGFTAYAK